MLKLLVLLGWIAIILMISLLSSTNAFQPSITTRSFHILPKFNLLQSSNRRFMSDNQDPIISIPKSTSSVEGSEEVTTSEETTEQKLRREKQEEIESLKAKEVFVTRDTGRYECQSCGYVYDTAKGYVERGIAPGTPWDEIEKFRCPQCGAKKNYFVPETETLSGFKENLKYGFGTNALTSGQKNLLIFGGLFLAFLVFLSGYLLE